MPFVLDPQTLDAESVRGPHISVSVYHQESADLLYFLA